MRVLLGRRTSKDVVVEKRDEAMEGAGARSFDLDCFDVKDERSIGRDVGWCAPLAISEGRRDGDSPLSSNLYSLDALIPTLDHLPSTQFEAEGFARSVLIERLARQQLADVAHADAVARFRSRSATDLAICVDVGRCRCRCRCRCRAEQSRAERQA